MVTAATSCPCGYRSTTDHFHFTPLVLNDLFDPGLLRIMRRINVHSWPQAQGQALADLCAAQAITVISVVTPNTTMRATGRELIRSALLTVLGKHLGHSPETVPLSSAALRAPALTVPGHAIGLSVSHEAGLTLAAIHRHGPIGVDLVRIETLPDWEPVAMIYLGRHAHQRILAMTTLQRPLAFGREWTRVEACLKCLGLGLVEWNSLLEHRMSRCETFELALPDGLTGTVAVLR